MIMGPEWRNPNYERGRQTRRLVELTALFILLVTLAFWLLRRGASPEVIPPAGSETPRTSATPLPGHVHENVAETVSQTRDGTPSSSSIPGEDLRPDPGAAEQSGTPADDFPARKALALSLYRRNELEAALEQVQAALALQMDDELLELRGKLEKEIRVQRNYDDARTANFAVLFDGYEHEEMKVAVLDILKEAYAEIGKELDHFPAQPISVILYTAKDFSDITNAPVWAGGLFGQHDGKIRIPVQGAAGHEQLLRRVLYHEYTHALLYDLAPSCPLWLQEGLAQYFSGDEAVSVGQVIPLGILAGGFPSEPRAALAAYMESLQAVADLVEEHGMPRLRQLLNKLGGGSDLEAAFAAAYGQPFSRWAEQWRPVRRGE
jgi:hypothetical protein